MLDAEELQERNSLTPDKASKEIMSKLMSMYVDISRKQAKKKGNKTSGSDADSTSENDGRSTLSADDQVTESRFMNVGIAHYHGVSGEFFIGELLEKYDESADSAGLFWQAAEITAAFAGGAVFLSRDKKNRNAAWSFVHDANYWLAETAVCYAFLINNLNSSTASLGGIGKANKYKPLKDAIRAKAVHYKNKSQAAKGLSSFALEKAKELGITVSEYSIQDRLENDWLRGVKFKGKHTPIC